MTDVQTARIDEIEGIHGGLMRRVRAQLGVTSWGMQVMTLPPDAGIVPRRGRRGAGDPPPRLAGARPLHEPRGTLVSWLYRIATNVSLTALERRARAEAAAPPIDEVVHMQPYPDALLDELPGSAPEPAAAIEERESVALAFVAALQHLPARQRAVLLLRDVLGWSAREVAELLDDSVASVNSALQRARARLERDRRDGVLARSHAPASAAEDDLVRRFVAAWEDVDVDGIARLLAADALMTMPPTPERIVGRDAIRTFLATTPAQGNLREIRLVPTAANRQPALAAYLRDPADGAFHAFGIMVLSVEGGQITSITGFAECGSLFGPFGLPDTLGSSPRIR